MFNRSLLVLSTLFWLYCSGIAAGASMASASTEAKIAFYRARIGGRSTYPAYARLGMAYEQKARETGNPEFHEEAVRHFRTSLHYQHNFEALWGIASALSERHKFSEALPYATEAADAMPSNLEALGILFDIHLALGNEPEAAAIADRMVHALAGFQAYTRLAALRQYKGDYSGALEEMIKARDSALPASTRAWIEVRIGSLHVFQGETPEARVAYEQALKLVPDYFFAQEHLAELEAAQGHWKAAEQLFQRLMSTRPEPQYRLALAEIFQQLNASRNASEEEQKALDELKDAATAGAQDVFRPLALLLLQNQSGAAEGLRWAEKDWEVRKDALTADTLAWAYCRNDRCAEALPLSERALKTGSKEPAILLHGAVIRSRVGLNSEARTLFQQAMQRLFAMGPAERKLVQPGEIAFRVENEQGTNN